MLLDLREIIELPGGKVSFCYNPDLSDAVTGSLKEIIGSAEATGKAENNAGLLTLTCNLKAECVCVCARCLKEFKYLIDKEITADITESGAGENPDGYCIKGDKIDLDEIIVTELILDTDEKLLCREACAGLCHHCGTDLNSGKCSCRKETDPRLAVLGQLLDN